jgi:putative phosphoribosyl transferase
VGAVGTVLQELRDGVGGRFGEVAWIPDGLGLVALAHAGASGWSARGSRLLLDVLHASRLSTLSFDVFAADDGAAAGGEPDLDQLAGRVAQVLDAVRASPSGAATPIGLLGMADGAAATLQAAAQRPGHAAAVVACGGALDPAAPYLPRVAAATLLIIGADDPPALRAYRSAMRVLRCAKRLEVVPRASQLFEDPGALDAMSHLAGAWFVNHLSRRISP